MAPGLAGVGEAAGQRDVAQAARPVAVAARRAPAPAAHPPTRAGLLEREGERRSLREAVVDRAPPHGHPADPGPGVVARALVGALGRAAVLRLVAEAVAVRVGLDHGLDEQLAGHGRRPARALAGDEWRVEHVAELVAAVVVGGPDVRPVEREVVPLPHGHAGGELQDRRLRLVVRWDRHRRPVGHQRRDRGVLVARVGPADVRPGGT